MIKALIADDHPVVRQGLRRILEESSEVVVGGEAATGAEVLAEVFKNEYDVVLLDISMPGRSGLEILREMKKEKPDLRVLILSTYPEEQYAVRALRDGAAG